MESTTSVAAEGNSNVGMLIQDLQKVLNNNYHKAERFMSLRNDNKKELDALQPITDCNYNELIGASAQMLPDTVAATANNICSVMKRKRSYHNTLLHFSLFTSKSRSSPDHDINTSSSKTSPNETLSCRYRVTM